jgi:hypothetical protein
MSASFSPMSFSEVVHFSIVYRNTVLNPVDLLINHVQFTNYTRLADGHNWSHCADDILICLDYLQPVEMGVKTKSATKSNHYLATEYVASAQ